MSTPSIGTVRIIGAWVTGIVAFVVIANIVEHLHSFRNDSPLNYALLILEVMLAVRFGMIVKNIKLNGGLSKRGSRRFNRWIAVIIVLGIFGELMDVLLNMLFGDRNLLKFVFCYFGPILIGVFLIEYGDKYKWVNYSIGPILKWIKNLDLVPSSDEKTNN